MQTSDFFNSTSERPDLLSNHVSPKYGGSTNQPSELKLEILNLFDKVIKLSEPGLNKEHSSKEKGIDGFGVRSSTKKCKERTLSCLNGNSFFPVSTNYINGGTQTGGKKSSNH